MTPEEQYVMNRITTWDKVKAYFIFLPFAIVVGLMLCALFGVEEAILRIITGVFVVTLAIGIALRTIVSAKVERLRNEFSNLKK